MLVPAACANYNGGVPASLCYCPVCQSLLDDFTVGGVVNRRPRAMCPKCQSLERHRLLAMVLGSMAPVLAAARVVLDIAPAPQLSRILRRETGGLYLTCDLDPAADRRSVLLQCDLTSLPLADESADVIVCSQVLEHVPDDAAAMRELRRVLSPGGVALVNVPYRKGTITDEDPSAPEDERIRRFGQADHVRYYGDDFDDRLRAAGLQFSKASAAELCGDELVYRLGLSAGETFWFVRKGGGDVPGVPRFEALAAFAGLSSREALSRSVAARAALVRWRGRARRRLGVLIRRVPPAAGLLRLVRRIVH
ncbi:MAG: class I SAM-dependent methyltransferase [Ilumatobacteraceae bacterium]